MHQTNMRTTSRLETDSAIVRVLCVQNGASGTRRRGGENLDFHSLMFPLDPSYPPLFVSNCSSSSPEASECRVCNAGRQGDDDLFINTAPLSSSSILLLAFKTQFHFCKQFFWIPPPLFATMSHFEKTFKKFLPFSHKFLSYVRSPHPLRTLLWRKRERVYL